MSLHPMLTPITQLRSAFEHGNIQSGVSCFGPTLTMLNGNFSDDPTQWEAHHFLAGDAIKDWLEMMIKQAEHKITALSVQHLHEHGSAGLLVTQESGHNKFREWENETVTYWLGKSDGEWKIMGFFIRDAKNPS